jgi:hypothetical protein
MRRGIGRLRAGGAAGTDADATAWSAAVTAAGGTFTAAQVSALSTFFRTLRAASMWPTKFACFNPMMGNELAAALIQYKGGSWAVATNTNFVSGDYAPTTGLTGNGTTKLLDTGLSVLSLTKSDFGMGTWTRTNPSETALRVDIGSSYAPTGNTDRFYNATRNTTTAGQASIGSLATAINGWNTTGLLCQETTGTTTQNVFANGVNVSSLGTWNNDGFQAGTVTVFALGGANLSNHALSGYYVGNNMDQAILTSAWTTLNTALGR